jgi:hypothetical protein
VKNRLERIYKEVVVAYFEMLIWHLPGGTNENFRISVKIVGILADTENWHLQSINQKCYH